MPDFQIFDWPKFARQYPYRFRTVNDALEALDRIRLGLPIDQTKTIWPFIQDGDNYVANSEYVNAPFEIGIVTKVPETIVTVVDGNT